MGTVLTELPKSDVEVLDSDIKKAIKRRRLEDDLIAVNEGRVTLNLITSDMKKIGLWSLIYLIAKMVMAVKKI